MQYTEFYYLTGEDLNGSHRVSMKRAASLWLDPDATASFATESGSHHARSFPLASSD